MNDPAATLDLITELIREHAPVDVATWWLDSLVDFNLAGVNKALDKCLGVEPYSAQFPTRRAAKEARDQHLRAAYALLSHRSVRAFQARIGWFLTNTFPEAQAYLTPPKTLSPVACELFLAVRTGIRLPGSTSQLNEILSGKSGEQVENRTISTEAALESMVDSDLQ